jgi:hypothetical protein
MLRGFAGVMPAAADLHARTAAADMPVGERWARRQPLSRGSPAWRYLAVERGLPEHILAAAIAADAVREGPCGSVWFAHRDGAGCVTGIEMRGPSWRGFSAGGVKTLFRLPGGAGPLPRVAVCEAAIDALSLATIEHVRPDTLYAATAGGMGPATLAALRQCLRGLSADPPALLVAATDADAAGRRMADRLAALADGIGARCDAILPPDGLNDWNDAVKRNSESSRGQQGESEAAKPG